MSATTLHDAVNTCLSVIGEPALTTANTSTNPNAVIARQIIEEVSRETQSKGWWFNESGGTITVYPLSNNDFDSNLPEEAVRYITIRSARVMQSRFLSSEELHKFTFNEEQVAFSILSARQAKLSGTTTSFTAIPDTVKNMGIEEVLFLQQSAEEKLLTIRLNTELKQGEKLSAEKLLIDAQRLGVNEDTNLKKVQQSDISADISIKGKQGSLVDAQTATEGSKKLDVEADTTIKTKQGNLIDEQVNTEKVRQSDISADVGIKEATRLRVHEETDLLQQQFITEIAESDKRQKEAELIEGQRLKLNEETMLTISQRELLEQQKLTEEENTTKTLREYNLIQAQEEKTDSEKTNVQADTTLKSKQGSLIDEQTNTEKVRQSDISADVSIKGKQGSLVDAQTATEGSRKLDVEADTSLKTKQGNLLDEQVDTEKVRQSDISADISIKGKQGSLVDAQTATEGSKKLDVEADTTIKTKQGALIDEQVNTEQVRQSDLSADINLKGKQGALVDSQELKTDAEKLLVDAQTALTADQEAKTVAEKELLQAQKTKLDEETSYIVTEEKNYNDNGGAILTIGGVPHSYKDFRPEMRIMGFQETAFNGLPAYKKKELLKDASAMRTSRTVNNASNIDFVNNILRYIGEEQVTNTSQSSLATEAYELMLKTNTELQARGWWFNTETDVDVVPVNSLISYLSSWLSIELNDVPTTKQKVGNAFYLRNLDTKKYNDWEGTQKATIIYKRDLDETPQKFQEYVEVRTARLLTELYPQSGIDIQRLPKLEQELETYFKDRQNDQGNYNIFNNYDTATRVGVNRNYDLV